jgi:hypothetical protein
VEFGEGLQFAWLSEKSWGLWRNLLRRIAMDSAGQTVSLDQIADLIVEKLTGSGRLANLGSANLESLEDETMISVDQITRDVISKLLGKQAELIESPKRCS